MTEKELQSLSDVFDGIFIGALLFLILYFIGWGLRILLVRFIHWVIEYSENKLWLSKRNKHRKKCGLPPIKK